MYFVTACREPLFIENRSGNTHSGFNATYWLDKAIALTKDVFEKLWLSGDTAYSQTEHFDRWSEENINFVFGYKAYENICEIADGITDWKILERPEKYTVKTTPRQKSDNIKKEVVERREYKNLELQKEEIAQFDYSPGKCEKTYRMGSVA